MEFFQKIATLLFAPENTVKFLKAALPTPAGPSGPHGGSSKSFKGQGQQTGKSIKAIGRGNSQNDDDDFHNYSYSNSTAYFPPHARNLTPTGQALKLESPSAKYPRSVSPTSSVASLQFEKLTLSMAGPTPPPRPYRARASPLGFNGKKPVEVKLGNKLPSGQFAPRTQMNAVNSNRFQVPRNQLQISMPAVAQSADCESPAARVVSNYSASGSGNQSKIIPAADFGRKRSTRTVSKINYNRSSKPNTGKRSPEAEIASQDLLAMHPVNCSSNLTSFRDCMDMWANQLHGLDDYTFLVKELGNRGGSSSCVSSEKVMAIFDWLADKSQQGRRIIRGPAEWGKLASTAISVLGRLGNVKAAKRVFDRARLNGMGGNVFAFSALISAYGRSGRCKEALEMFECMKAEGCKPNLITYNALIDACSKGGMPDTARSLFSDMQQSGLEPDKITFNSLMGAYGRAGQWQEAESVFHLMGLSGLCQDLHSYNTLIDAFCKGGQLALAERLLDTMTSSGVQPNVITYSSIIDGYAKSGKEEEALATFSKMREIMKRSPGIHPDSVCFNTMLDMYGKAGRIEEAMAVRSEMESAGLGTDLVSFNALIDMMGKAGRPREAARLFEQMQRQGHHPNVLTWSALIGGFARSGFHTEAMKYFQEFKQAGLQPDVVLYSLLIDVHGKHGLVQEAMGLLKEMVANGIPPNVVTYNSLIDAYGRMGQVERAVTTMDEMKSKGLTPNAVTFNCVIDAFGKEGRAEEALQMAHRMREEGQSPDSFTVSALIDANGKRGDAWAAVKIFREMQEWGVKPNVVTFSAVLNVCRWLSSYEEAAELLKEAQRSDDKIYGVACGLLMGGVSRPGFWEVTESVFDFVDREDRERDRCTGMAFYNALTDLLWHFGQRDGSFRVLRAAMRRQVYKVPVWSSESDGGLDLHQMSVGAALTMLHSWLLDLYAVAAEGRPLPRLMTILTGWGKHSKVLGESSVKREVDSCLHAMGSPFKISKSNEGRIVGQGNSVKVWLLSAGVKDFISLRDDRMEVELGRHALA